MRGLFWLVASLAAVLLIPTWQGALIPSLLLFYRALIPPSRGSPSWPPLNVITSYKPHHNIGDEDLNIWILEDVSLCNTRVKKQHTERGAIGTSCCSQTQCTGRTHSSAGVGKGNWADFLEEAGRRWEVEITPREWVHQVERPEEPENLQHVQLHNRIKLKFKCREAILITEYLEYIAYILLYTQGSDTIRLCSVFWFGKKWTFAL